MGGSTMNNCNCNLAAELSVNMASELQLTERKRGIIGVACIQGLVYYSYSLPPAGTSLGVTCVQGSGVSGTTTASLGSASVHVYALPGNCSRLQPLVAGAAQ